ncbi:hypothetical protein PAXINDRAFT_34018, partial [Paxillus involutus ATCC 200175]
GKMPYKLLNGTKPNIAGLPEWGARVWAHNTTGSKLDMCAREGRWVGFDAESNGHRIY